MTKYVKDAKTFERHFRTLSLSKNYINEYSICFTKGPTHVVTALTYGLNANFVFTKKTSMEKTRQEISGSLKIAVHSIPSVKIDGEGHAHINETVRRIIDGMESKLFGDFVLPQQPTTFEVSFYLLTALRGGSFLPCIPGLKNFFRIFKNVSSPPLGVEK